LSAATWLGRYRRRTLLLDAGEQRNRRTDEVHGYLARDPASPRDILDAV
jgi:thioredoxin reductase